MHERHRRLVGEHLGADQLAGGGHRGGVVQAGELGHERQRGVVAEHGGRARDRRRVAAQAADPHEHGARRRARRDRVDGRDVGRVRRDALGAQRLGQLDQQQRVPAGRVVAGARERLVAADQLGARRARSAAAGAALTVERIARDLADQVRVGVALERADAADHGHAQPVEPAHEVTQPAQRRLVAPLQVVDHAAAAAPARRG